MLRNADIFTNESELEQIYPTVRKEKSIERYMCTTKLPVGNY